MLTTREIAIGENNRVTIDLTVQPLGDGAPPNVMCAGEVSRDGKMWIAAPELTVRATAPSTTRHVAPVSGDKLRFAVTTDGGASRECPVDLRVRLDCE